MRKKPLVFVLFAAVIAALLGGTAAYAALDKTVTVVVDGHPDRVRTFAGSVAGTLGDAGVHLGAHDTVAPDLTAPVHNGSVVYVGRGRPLTLTLDGRVRTVWVTARSVDDALGWLGLSLPGEYVSASRSLSIPRSGLALTVRLPQRVTVLVDGHRIIATTTAPTVRALLAQLRVRLARTDTVNKPFGLYPTDGLVLQVTRYRSRTVEQDVPIAFPTVQHPDSALYQGQSRVVSDGATGLRVLTFRLQYRNGRIIGRRLVANKVTVAPQPRVVDVGTATPPPPPPTSYPSSHGGLNWAALANCESGGNPRAVSPGGTYRGLYQFSYSTWYGVGGSGDPIDASPAEQTYRAQLLYDRSGAGAWPVCGRDLFT